LPKGEKRAVILPHDTPVGPYVTTGGHCIQGQVRSGNADHHVTEPPIKGKTPRVATRGHASISEHTPPPWNGITAHGMLARTEPHPRPTPRRRPEESFRRKHVTALRPDPPCSPPPRTRKSRYNTRRCPGARDQPLTGCVCVPPPPLPLPLQ
jgi:hypothetical protein